MKRGWGKGRATEGRGYAPFEWVWGSLEGIDTHKQSPAKKHSPLVAMEPRRKRLERVYVFIYTDSKEAPDAQQHTESFY